MLVGRAREQDLVTDFLAAAARGRGGALVVRGVAGVGKSTFLAAMGETVPDAVAIRCSARDPKPWSTIRSIIAALPHARCDRTGASTDPATLGASLVDALAEQGRKGLVMVTVDDAHRADAWSIDALCAVGRAIRHERAVLLLGVDPGATDDDLSLVFPAIELAGLSPLDASRLLGARLSTAVTEELTRRTGGNPRALLTLAEQLSEDERRGRTPIGALPPLGDDFVGALTANTERLPTEEQLLLLALAAEPALDRDALRDAADACGVPPNRVDRLGERGIVVQGPEHRLRFAEPLLGVAVYQRANTEERRAVHRLLADVAPADGARRIRHLALAAEAPDEDAARRLEVLADRALARGDASTAGRALVHAAELSVTVQDEVHRLTAAGVTLATAHERRDAIAVLDRALALTGDPATCAEILIARAAPLLAPPDRALASAELADLAARVTDAHPDHAQSLLALAGVSALALGRLREAKRLAAAAGGDGFAGTGRAAGLGVAVHSLVTLLGGDVAGTLPRLRAVEPPDRQVRLARAGLVFEYLVAAGLTWAGESSAASRLVAELIERGEAEHATVLLARALTVRADLYDRSGLWTDALRDAERALELAHTLDDAGAGAFALVVLARLEAALGRATAVDHAYEARATAVRLHIGFTGFWAVGALGFAALTDGRTTDAIGHLEVAEAVAEREGVWLVTAMPWAPDLVEAYARVGRLADAAGLVRRLEDQRVGAQGPLAAALLARCQGIVTTEDPDERFAAAIEHHRTVLSPFEHARTLLAWGERLRRDRRVGDSRVPIEEAAAMFAALGATPWVQRATAERVAGGKLAPGSPKEGCHSLTPQERRVALAVSSGATNREVAASLFLSPRTVEHHVANLFRKLGVKSRSELTRVVLTDPDFAERVDPEADPE